MGKNHGYCTVVSEPAQNQNLWINQLPGTGSHLPRDTCHKIFSWILFPTDAATYVTDTLH